MRKKEKDMIVQSVLEPELLNLGFDKKYSNDEHRNEWYFVKTQGDLKQTVSIMDYYSAISVEFSTNVYGQKQKKISEIVKLDCPLNMLGWYEYTNLEEFKLILEKVKPVILNEGMELLKKLSIPTIKEYPHAYQYQYLCDHKEEAVSNYRLLMNELTIKEQYLKIGRIARELREKEFYTVEKSLIELAAVLGQYLIINFRGDWKWTSSGIFWVEHVGVNDMVENVLMSIFSVWARKSEMNEKIFDMETAQYIKKWGPINFSVEQSESK